MNIFGRKIKEKALVKGKEKPLPQSVITLLSNLFNRQVDYGTTELLETYQKSLYVYACVSKIAKKIGSIDWKLFKITNTKGDVDEIIINPLIDLIYKPNPFQTKAEFWESVIINKLLCGDAFIFKARNEQGKVLELWNLRPDRITIATDKEKFISHYIFRKEDGTEIEIPRQDIIHDKYPNPLSEYLGLAPLRPASLRVDVENYANHYQRDFFINNAKPDGVLSTPNKLTQEQVNQIKREWNSLYQGKGKNSKTAILQGDMKFDNISISQKEMDFIESMHSVRDDILTAFGVPKPIVAVTDDVNRANAETAIYIFQSEVIKPEMERLMEKINEEMVIPDFGADLYFDFVDPTPEDRLSLISEYESSLKNGWRTINEVRELENMPPLEGGDTPLVSMALIPLNESNVERVARENKLSIYKDKQKLFVNRREFYLTLKLKELLALKIKKEIKDKSAKETTGRYQSGWNNEQRKEYQLLHIKKLDDDIESFKALVVKIFEAQEKRVVNSIEVTKEKSFKVGINWGDEDSILRSLAMPIITSIASKRGKDICNLLGVNFTFGTRLQEAVDNKVFKFAENVNNTTEKRIKEQLQEGLADGESIKEIRQRVKEIFEHRKISDAEMIARTEVISISNKAELETYKDTGLVQKKEWLATLDDRVRDSHLMLDGEVVAVESPFSNGLMHPGDVTGDGGEVVNCRCAMIPIIK
jgi:HK97 family phage portal protein